MNNIKTVEIEKIHQSLETYKKNSYKPIQNTHNQNAHNFLEWFSVSIK